MQPIVTTPFAVALSCAIVLAFTTPSASAGPEKINSKEPIVQINPVERFDWTGFYIGGNAGGYWTTDSRLDRFEDVFDLQGLDNELDNATDTEFDPQSFVFPHARGHAGLDSEISWLGGGQVGAQYQFGHFVVGVEGDFDATDISSSSTFREMRVIPQVPFGNEEADIDFRATRRLETDWTASARARIGYARGPVLFYATGGVAFTDVNVWAIDTAMVTLVGFTGLVREATVSGTDRNIDRNDNTEVGYTVGGGFEWAASHMISIGIEGRHSDFGSHTYRFRNINSFETPGPAKINLEDNLVMLKVNLMLSHFFGH